MVKRSYLAAAALFGAIACAAVAVPIVFAQSAVVRAGHEDDARQSGSRATGCTSAGPTTSIASARSSRSTTSNVAQLRMAWSRGLPAGTQESTPLVYRGVMYVIAPGASIQALNATNGDLIWEYRRSYAAGVPTAAARSKNLGIYEDMIYFGAPDGFLLALDAQTGKLRWETKVDDGQITAGGLLVADGKVISNRTCQQGEARVLLHRRARCEDREGGLEVSCDRGRRRARR